MKKSLTKVSSEVHFWIQQPKRQKFLKFKRILLTVQGFRDYQSFYFCKNQIKSLRSNKMILSFPFGHSSFGSILTENCYNNCYLILLIFYHLIGYSPWRISHIMTVSLLKIAVANYKFLFLACFRVHKWWKT